MNSLLSEFIVFAVRQLVRVRASGLAERVHAGYCSAEEMIRADAGITRPDLLAFCILHKPLPILLVEQNLHARQNCARRSLVDHVASHPLVRFATDSRGFLARSTATSHFVITTSVSRANLRTHSTTPCPCRTCGSTAPRMIWPISRQPARRALLNVLFRRPADLFQSFC